MVVGCAEDPDSCGATSHGPVPGELLCVSDLHAEKVIYFWLGIWTAEIHTVLLASVLGQADVAVCLEKNMFIRKASAARSERGSSRDHSRPLRLSFALAVVLTMNARRF